MNNIPIEPIATGAMNGFISFLIPVAVLVIILKLIMYSFEQKIKATKNQAPKRENQTRGYEMNKNNTNTILLGVIAVCLAFLVLYKIYQEIMINIAVNKAINIEKEVMNQGLEHMDDLMGNYKNLQGTFEEENKKFQTVPKMEMPQIEIPKVDTQQDNQVKSIENNINEEREKEKERVRREMMN